MTIKNLVCIVGGTLGGLITSFLGGWDAGLTTLFICMAVDFFTGFLCATVFKNSPKTQNGAYESRAGFKGLCRKCVIIMFVGIGYRMDLLIGLDYVRDGVCIAFTINELVSIVENAGLMGVPIPRVIMDMIEILKEKEENIDG